MNRYTEGVLLSPKMPTFKTHVGRMVISTSDTAMLQHGYSTT